MSVSKYLIEASYTTDGVKASSRKADPGAARRW
jgi:hypothetical protein